MSECKKCMKYIECLEKFRIRKLEGYYDEVPGLTEEQYFRDIDESAGCTSYQPYPRANGKSLTALLNTFASVIYHRWRFIRTHCPYRRAVYLAFHGKTRRARSKNVKRVTDWYNNELRRSWSKS